MHGKEKEIYFGKKKKIKNVNYYRDIPCNEDLFRTFFIGYNYGIIPRRTYILGAIILKWIKDKKVKIEKRQGNFGKEKIVIILSDKTPKDLENSKEMQLYDMLYEASEDGVLETKEFKFWCTDNYTTINSWFEHINTAQRNILIKEGKIEVIADSDGLLKVDRERLKKVNSFGELMIAARHGNTAVKKGDKLAGTRIIPLVIKKEKMEKASEICSDAPILKILPFTMKKAAVITTGNEVFYGRIKDGFTPVIEKKINEFGVEMAFHETFNDDDKKITKGCLDAVNAGIDIIFCTGGMSVDPDDKTPLAIKNTGADIISYGSPVLPGAMFLLSYYKKDDRIIPICGLPGCAMYNKRTIFDMVLPRLLANDMITSDELASLGEGGFCLNCDVCTFPNCGFGKGW